MHMYPYSPNFADYIFELPMNPKMSLKEKCKIGIKPVDRI